MRVEWVVLREVNSQRRACRTDAGIGRIWSREALAVAQVNCAPVTPSLEPGGRSGAKGGNDGGESLAHAAIVGGVAAAREVTTGAQFSAEPSRGGPVDPLWRAAHHQVRGVNNG